MRPFPFLVHEACGLHLVAVVEAAPAWLNLGLQLPVCYTDRNTNEENGGLFGYHLLVRGTQGMPGLAPEIIIEIIVGSRHEVWGLYVYTESENM